MALIAAGGTGEIYSAKDIVLGRTIAVKTLKPDYQYNEDQIERLAKEAKAAAQLEHPNIVPIHALGISPSKGLYFTMKRLRGDSLRHIITQLAARSPGYVREYTPAALLNIFLKICQGVNYAHSKGIIHRDLKPENIIVGNFGEVTIIDWGLVKVMNNTFIPPKSSRCFPQPTLQAKEETAAHIEGSIELPPGNPTLEGELNGTPRFMSPEQILGDANEIDTKTDIYALGIILYELITYTNPFGELRLEEDILNAVARGQYTRPRQTYWGKSVIPELEAICLKAMHVNKENRYQSVGDIIRDIIAHQEGREVAAYKTPIAGTCVKFCRRNPIKTSIVLSSIFAIIAFVFATRFITSLTTTEAVGNAVHSFKLASQKLNSLDTQLRKNNETLNAYSREILQSKLNEVDNLTLSANFILSTLPSQYQSLPSIKYWREHIITRRIQFTLVHGTLNDIKNVKGMLDAQYGRDFSGFSHSTHQALLQLDTAFQGLCTLSITSQTDSASFSIAPLTDDPETGRKILGTPVELDSHVIPANNLVIPKGDYAVTFVTDGKPDTTLFFSLTHGENAVIDIYLPAQIPQGMVFIPEPKRTLHKRNADDNLDNPPHEQSALAFFIAEKEVTYGEYREFWLQIEDPIAKYKFLPKIRLEEYDEQTVPAWDDQGTFNEATFNGYPMFSPTMPVVGIPHDAAVAFCEWKGKKMQRICRLPTAAEWIRAASGDDKRLFPWGNTFNQEYAFTADNADAKAHFALTAPVGSFKHDVSPYGVLDMAGNAREWTSSRFKPDNAFQILGASYTTTQRYLQLNKPSAFSAFPSDVGFRYVIEYQDYIDSIPQLRTEEDIPIGNEPNIH